MRGRLYGIIVYTQVHRARSITATLKRAKVKNVDKKNVKKCSKPEKLKK